ncbi:MAG TPA: tubulin-like doman-containing protein [Lamprocystis sp. (in: g-proteobacteria)]|nr:tubulin-like doman-containing protein [Lamprocystis sp. (in: g-proteobacteria)]
MGFLGQQHIQGANQRRRFGRLLFAHNAATIRGAVTAKVNALGAGRRFQCAFHIFATLGGGTGSGGLIDLVTLIRTRYPGSGADEFPIFVYVYVTDADEQGANVGHFFQNQFTGLRDLNALICGRLCPPLLGDDIAVGTFAGAEPIAQLAITAPLNSANHQIPLEIQIQIVAEACFERIVSRSSGQMGPAAQRSLTGEDILSTFPTEPPGRPERSYRFSALGMRRWEVPAEKLTTLLALDLLASALRQMLFNHWHDTNGFSHQLADGSGADAATAVTGLLAEIEDQRRPEPKTETLVQRLRLALGQQATGLSRASGQASLTLRTIEQDLAGFFQQHFETGGVDLLVRQRQAELPGRVNDAVRRLEARLTGLWLDRTNPLALARVPQVLDEMAARLRREMEAGPANDAVGERRRPVFEARRLEWDKLTWLSARLTAKRTALIEAHGSDCGALHEGDLRTRLAELDRTFVRDLLGRLANVKNRFMSVQQALQRLLGAVQQERNQIDGDLRALQSNVAANKYEFDPAALDAFLAWMRRHPEHQQGAAFLMREEIASAIGSSQPLSALDEGAISVIDDRLRRVAKGQAELIHQDYEANRQGQPILEDSVMDILKKRYEADRQAFLSELQEFLGQAAVCLHLRNDTQPMALLGAGVGVPHMPRRLLLIGLPRHAFTQTLQQAFGSAMAAGQDRLLQVFEHEDPGQIRLLTVDYWLAARFSTVVKALGDRYQATTAGALNPDTTYFCNIDPDGEQGLRPDLFLPDDGTMRLRYEAELWLGQQPGIDVVQVDDNGVFLIRQDADGRHAEPLGPTLEAAIASPNYPKMFGLHGRVGAALSGFDRQGFADLLNQQRTAMERQYGLTSPAYERWDRMLKLLKPLVD